MRLHDQRGHAVRQHVADEDQRQPRAGRDRGLDIGLLAHRQHHGAHQPHHARDFRHRDGDDDGEAARRRRARPARSPAARRGSPSARPSRASRWRRAGGCSRRCRPITSPIEIDRIATVTPTMSETRAPNTVRVHRSRPNWSVPNQLAALGGFSRFSGSRPSGSVVPSHGASSAASTNSSTMKALATTNG